MSSPSSSPSSSWTSGLFLPATVIPLRYDVALSPDLEQFTFQGQVDITIRVDQPTKEIVCHSFEIEYPNNEAGRPRVDLRATSIEANFALSASGVDLDSDSQRVRFSFDEVIQPGEYILAAVFTGILNDQLCGFYRSEYVSARDGRRKYMAVTQFEATDCRRALPCWDEPSSKAVFKVTLVVEPTQVAVSNMPVKSAATILQSAEEQRADAECRSLIVPKGWIRYVYDDSPIMSSYLLAFVVGEFDYISTFTTPSVDVPGARPVELRIYTPVGETKQGKFALEVATKCLALYETFFKVPYPLPKLDLLAVPDFASGAMENCQNETHTL